MLIQSAEAAQSHASHEDMNEQATFLSNRLGLREQQPEQKTIDLHHRYSQRGKVSSNHEQHQ